MKLVESSFEILGKIDRQAVLKKIELCGRVCYKSEKKITKESASKFVSNLIKAGHESVLEHEVISVRFICDRAVSHELVRHRLIAVSQESQRYCRYDDELSFIIPEGIDGALVKNMFVYATAGAESAYKHMLLNCNCSPQIARSVLPNATKTELIITANLREWRHILKLRTGPRAHPDMRRIMIPLQAKLAEALPEVFA